MSFRRESTASMRPPDERADTLLRKLCCWMKPRKLVDAGASAKKEDNINCINGHFSAASGKKRDGEEVRGGEALGC